MKIAVEIEELNSPVKTSHVVADYVRALLKVRSLRRAVGEALLEAEHRKRKLTPSRVAQAQKLFDSLKPPGLKPLLRRMTGPTAQRKRE
jgi:hypothetical protein